MEIPKGPCPRAPSIVRWLVSLGVVAALLTTFASHASADDVAELANGGRVRGTILELVVNDHVTIELVDGTVITIAWSELSRIVYAADDAPALDASSLDAQSVAASSPPPPTQLAAPFRDPNARYRALPRRAGSVLLVLGGLVGVSEGLSLITSAFDGASFDRPGAAAFGGIVTVGVGTLMFTYGVRRLRTRRQGIEQLRSEGYMIARAPIDLGIDAGAGRFVPTLRLRF